MRVERNRGPHFAAQEVVNGHARALAHDVPEGAIHAAKSVVPFDAAAEIRLQVGRLPDVFNLVHVAADHERLGVLLQKSCNRQRALPMGSASQSVEAGLTGHQLYDHQLVGARLSEDHLQVGDL